MVQFQEMKLDDIRDNPFGSCREHPATEVDQLCGIIKEVGFIVPVVVDENDCRLNGDIRLRAARKLGLEAVPVAKVKGLSLAQKHAFILADNRIPENGKWNRQQLAQRFIEIKQLLLEAKIDIETLGFSSVEVDQIFVDLNDTKKPSDDIDPKFLSPECVTQPGDIWLLDPHVLGCGDARDQTFLQTLMGDRKADAGFFDAPYNVRVADIGGRGRYRHPEFEMASGEMSTPEFEAFVFAYMMAAIGVSRKGAFHFHCMGWLHLAELILAGRQAYGKIYNLAVWAKPNPGLGQHWRSQHEEIGIFQVVGDKPVRPERSGRSRSNLWQYRALNQFGPDRMESLEMHPTTKPIQMIADAFQDCTRRGDLVLDTFCGSGSSLMAAEQIGRHAVCVEIEPRYLDATIRRWQGHTGKDAVHLASGVRFDELAGKLRRSA
jgi:hypothetical protein